MGIMLRWVLEKWFVKIRCGWNWLLIVSILEFCISSVELSDARVRATGVWYIILVHMLNICSLLGTSNKNCAKWLVSHAFLLMTACLFLYLFWCCFADYFEVGITDFCFIDRHLLKILDVCWYIFFQFMRRPWFKL